MNLTPRGCSSIGGELASYMETCRERMLTLFTAYGYNPFNPAEFQRLEETMKNLPRRRRERVVVLNTPFGEPCCLRADITLSALSYMATHHAPEEFPLRLCYAERVFSLPRPPKENLEDTQIGVELLGWEGIGSDVEVAALLLKALDTLGLRQSVLVLGDASIVPALFADLPGAVAGLLVERLQEGAYRGYTEILDSADGVADADREILRELPRLKGNVDLFERAGSLFGERKRLLDPLRGLAQALEKLGYAARLRIDLGFIRDLSYYCGPIFNVYAAATGGLLGGGGRYEGALSGTGFSCQAVGYALSLRELALACQPAPGAARVMVWSGALPAERAMEYAARLADRQVPFEISWNPDGEASRNFAKARGCAWWVNLGEGYAEEIATGRRADPQWIGGV